jgi:hypothetical protein
MIRTTIRSRETIRLIFISILIVLLAMPCFAFGPDTHEEFSKSAALIYQKCTGHAMPEKYIAAFADGAKKEDDPELTRVLNWHFYNNGKKIGHYWKYGFYCDGSNEHIFQARLDKLESLLAQNKYPIEIYTVAGRIVHHIQDMSSPPHTAPIYHVGSDKFDNYKSTLNSNADDAPICGDIKGITEPHELLEQAAQNTLKAINSPVAFDNGKKIEGETWKKFWDGPQDRDLLGFKTYGEYGDAFGMVPPCHSEACGAYSSQVYDRFYNERCLRATIDTVRILIYLDKHLQE